MSIIPRDILPSIFSYLGLNDLGNAAKVCKKWNEVQKTDLFWKNKCLAYLDNAQPIRGSWKERFKIIHNWMITSSTLQTYPSLIKVWGYCSDFVILDNNTPYEVYPTDAEFLTFAIRNFFKDKITIIDFTQLKSTRIIGADLHNEIWVALNTAGRIFCFNIRTGECIQQIIPEKTDKPVYNTRDLANLKIKCNGREVIIIYDREVKIWNIQTGLLERTLDISMLPEIWSLNTTDNFIICFVSDTEGLTGAVAIKKNNGVIKQLTGFMSEPIYFVIKTIATSGCYVAILSQLGEVKIFKETAEDLVLINAFSVLTQPFDESASIDIYDNWLYVNKDSQLSIWDIHTGQNISHINHIGGRFKFRTNGICLFTRLVLRMYLVPRNPLYKVEQFYTLYNFDRNITQINAPNNPPKAAPKKKCNIM